MISLLWQDSVLSLLDQSVYPQEERWLTCTSLEETVQVLSSGAILEEKIAAIAGAYGLCQAALAAQDLQQTPQFDEVLAGARAMLLESRNHSRDMQLALDFMADPPEAYTRNVDRITTLLATAVTFERQQVVADRNTARNGTDLMSEGTRVLLRTDRGAFHSAAPTGALGIARRGWKRKLIEQVTLCEGRPSLTAGTLLAQELSKDNVPCTLIPDQAAATFLARPGAHMVLVDGILAAKNGDMKALGQAEGDPNSVTAGLPCGDAEGWTPAYDVVPAFLITGMITDRNISCAPYEETLEDTVKNAPRKMIVDFGS